MKKAPEYPSSACKSCAYRFRPKTSGTCKTCVTQGIQYQKKSWSLSAIEKEEQNCPDR